MARTIGAARIASFGESVFSEVRALTEVHGAVPLHSGAPDFAPPGVLVEAVERALRDGHNRYTFPNGASELKTAIAEHTARFHGPTIDPESVVVTCGAYEAMFCACSGLLDPGDEVIVFEPFFDAYLGNLNLAGATLRPVLLHPPDSAHSTWWFDDAELGAAFGPRTRALLLNTPHNPTGKVFTRSELERIGELAERHDVLVITDEVYEHVVFAPATHVRPSTIPSLTDRCLSISSASKMFDVTGWRVGWMQGPTALLRPAMAVHRLATWCAPAPFQIAIASALRLPDSFFAERLSRYERLRARMVDVLDKAGIAGFVPEGTYFVMSDISELGFEEDRDFVRFLIRDVGVAAIPASALYTEEHHDVGRKLVRFAFCRHDHDLDTAAERLSSLQARVTTRC